MIDRNKEQSADVVIAGGGASGLMAAIAAAQAGAKVVVCELLDGPGVKLLATGGGRCNLTNMLPAAELMRRFGRQGRFMAPALEAMDSQGLLEFFHGLGVPTASPDGEHVYPASNMAADVQGALVRRCRELGVTILPRRPVTGLILAQGACVGAATAEGPIAARSVIVATGGKSYRSLGGTGDGYELARRAGHTIVAPLPALVALLTREKWPRRCAGVGIEAQVRIDLPGRPRQGLRGNLLFTHQGVSGPAVLDVSGDVATLLKELPTVPLRINLSPGSAIRQWLQRLDDYAAQQGQRMVRILLERTVPSALAEVLLELAQVPPEARAAHLTRPQRDRLAGLITDLPLTAVGTEGFDSAMVTRGGVALKEVDPRTLRSRLAAGLFFAGEVLDLDGPCGGFNLQWAFSSGALAGRSAAVTALGNNRQ